MRESRVFRKQVVDRFIASRLLDGPRLLNRWPFKTILLAVIFLMLTVVSWWWLLEQIMYKK